MRKPSLAERLRYAFDITMSKGPVALIGWLALLSLTVVLFAAVVLTLAGIAPQGEEPLDWVEALWASLMRTLDPGTMGGDEGWGFRLVMLGVTLGGIFVISTLIGVLTTGIEGKLEDLRKGRSRVVESGHTVILGWSAQVFSIISELALANENQPRSCIVVLGDKDKVEMEDEVRDRVGRTGRTRIVCRRGNPADMGDLDIVSLHTARAVIILAPEGDDDPDASVIKTLLAVLNNPNRRPELYHIVAELHDPKNVAVARLVGRDELEVVSTGDLIARMMAQTCRQSGLSVVYSDLLDFAGDEIYFKEEPALVGQTLGEVLLAYEDSAVIGLCPRDGPPHLNPPLTTRVERGDRIIAISEDDDTIRLSGRNDLQIEEDAIQTARPAAPAPEGVLILGWNWRAPAVINELDHYVPAGSTVTVLADDPEGAAEIARQCRELHNLTVTFQAGDTTDRRELENLPLQDVEHVILLSYSDHLDTQKADARTLITLLHLRDIAAQAGYAFSIVSEIMDIRNRYLAEVARADDFIVSDRLTSLLMAQVAENKALGAVFDDLFDPQGSEIYLKPASDYVRLGQAVNFYTVVEAARRRGEVAFGYRLQIHGGDPARDYGVVINPRKSARVTFSGEDSVIVLAED